MARITLANIVALLALVLLASTAAATPLPQGTSPTKGNGDDKNKNGHSSGPTKGNGHGGKSPTKNGYAAERDFDTVVDPTL